ncbi:MAG: hypothetical protein SynsKO_31330 [Synoicihabitans sp.]
MAPPPIVRLLDLDHMVRFKHEAMATGFEIFLPKTDDIPALRGIAEEAFRELDRIEVSLSFYREGSDVTKINRARENEVVRVSEITHRCLLHGMEISGASEGAFDPFSGYAAIEAKGQKIPLHLRDLEPPDTKDQRPVIALDPDQPLVTKLEGIRWLDLGAIGKGAALDAMAVVLREWDISSAVLNGGGSSILVFGSPPTQGEAGWKISLPQTSDNEILTLDAPFALGASGDGFQPGHVIGSSAFRARPQSLVLAPNATLADALSTAFLLMPDHAIKTLLADDPRFAVIATHASAPQVASGVFELEKLPRPPEASIVIPCWCESSRLPPFLRELARDLTSEGLATEILVVDDGSPGDEPAKTAAAIEHIRHDFPCLKPLITAERHLGKGGAIIHGWQQSTASARWLAFVDADGAVPSTAVVDGLKLALTFEQNQPLIAANRYHVTPQRPVERSWLRQRSGGWFAQWANKQLDLGTRDSQCGFKIVPAAWWRSVSNPWREIGYAFDLELLLAAKFDGVPIHNFDIPWREIGGSNVDLRDGLELVQTVRRLRDERRD